MINYDDKLSGKIKNIPPSGIRKFFDIVHDLPDAISLGVGEPDFVTPWAIRDAAIKSLQKGYTAYTSNKGLPELRESICEYLESRFSLKYKPETEAMVTVGASEAIDLAIRALVNEGDEILVPMPSYVSYAPLVTLAGAKAVGIEPSRADFKLTPEDIERAVTKKTKAIVFPFPNNPTGAVMEREYLEKVAPVIIKHDLIVLSDEIYAELTYGGAHVSIASLPGMWERTILMSGFSKAFAMTGWRVGYIAAPKPLLDAMLKIHQYSIMCASTMSQYAAHHALKMSMKEDFATVIEMRESYDRRRRLLVGAFNEMGLECFEPKGAFYAFPCVKSTGMDGQEFAEKLLYTKSVAVVPGDAFGPSGKYYVRCCYATAVEQLYEVIERLNAFLSGK